MMMTLNRMLAAALLATTTLSGAVQAQSLPSPNPASLNSVSERLAQAGPLWQPGSGGGNVAPRGWNDDDDDGRRRSSPTRSFSRDDDDDDGRRGGRASSRDDDRGGRSGGRSGGRDDNDDDD
ncbi:hypothetical protein [Neomegalonema perideroedes]|uniref:hypothetical protein n=1 Tax=Neomegalonema perideroedes TaxID=217219 RepID=UPI000363ACC6|nr:hypothetical protein [Neomegalonema perideroedes]